MQYIKLGSYLLFNILRNSIAHLKNWSCLPFNILRDCNRAIYLNWSYLQFYILQCIHIAIYKIEVTSLLIDCNAIALQSIKRELPPFYILRDCIAIMQNINWSYLPFNILQCDCLANKLNWSYLPFFILHDCIRAI